MIIVFDTEATDLVPGQICQLSYLMVDDMQVQGKNLFFSVDDMSEGAQEVHGFSMDMLTELSGGLYFEDMAQEIFDDFSRASLLVGHNVAADDRYLRVEFERAGMKLKKIATFCTMNYATGITNLKRKVEIGRPKPPRLEELCAHYGITEEASRAGAAQWFGGGDVQHDARYDTAATYLCLVAAHQQGDLRGVLPAVHVSTL